jgi:hypothetical protein
MNLCDKETRFDLDCRSSPFHNTPHRDQSKLVKPIEIDSYLNVPDEIDKRHPNASASAKALMLESVMMVNDDTIDWQSVMLPPPTQKKMRPAKGKETAKKGSTSRVPIGKHAPKDGKTQGSTKKKSKGDSSVELEWAWETMRTRGFKMGPNGELLDFRTDLDTSEPGEELRRDVSHKRLILWPVIPDFGERQMDDVCGGDNDIIQLHSALCTLHCDMRMTEMVSDAAEMPMRQHGGKAHLDRFNQKMKNDVKIRHVIAYDSKNDKFYPVALNGKDSLILREDWLLMEADGVSENEEWVADKCEYSSAYFQALAAEFAKMKDSTQLLEALRIVAICALEYARAMRELRRSPAEIRAETAKHLATLPKPTTPQQAKEQRAQASTVVHDAFDKHSRAFCIAWVASGRTLKGYGWHMWASMSTLFRRYGCMEILCQTAMEGTIGKLGRIMPHIALHARGNYTTDVKASGPEAKQRVLEQRRADAISPAQAIHDELSMEATFGEYQLLPCRKRSQRYQYTAKDIMAKIDEMIAAGRMVGYKEWVEKWRRYMGITALLCAMRGRVKLRRSREHAQRTRGAARTYGETLLAEYKAYYANFPLRSVTDAADDLTRAAEMRARKRDWQHKHLQALADIERDASDMDSDEWDSEDDE